MPACALGCLGLNGATPLAALGMEPLPCQEKHKFDEDLPVQLTLRQYFSRQLGSGAQVLKAVESEIMEDSEEAFEIRVTECALVEPMLEFDAGRIGNAWLCDGDYGHAQGFNPKIKLIRDKTLMLGHSCCNHRYEWTE